MMIDKPMPDVFIERMQSKDLKQVMKIETEAFPDPWHVSFFKRQLHPRKKHMHLYVARLSEKVIGYIVFYINFGEAHIMNIAVDKTYRRQGVAKYLFDYAFEIIKTNAAEVIFLEVADNNTAALQLYRQYGFEVYGKRKRYYRNGGDAYVMRKEI